MKQARMGKKRNLSFTVRLHDWFAERLWLSLLLCVFSAVLVPFVYQVLIEFVRIGSVSGTFAYVLSHWKQMLLGWIVLVLVWMILLLLSLRPAVPAGVMGCVLFVGGMANLFKLSYRGNPVVPRDLVILKDAAVIMGELELRFTREMYLFVAVVIVVTMSCSLIRLPWPTNWKMLLRWGVKIVACVFCVGAISLYMNLFLWNEEKDERFGMKMAVTGYSTAYYSASFVTSFLYYLDDLFVSPPENYGQAVMETLAQEVMQADRAGGRKADILIVMAESWVDLQQAVPAQYSQDLLKNYREIAAEGISGYLLSESYGGGTSNIEFSALTGYSLSFLSEGSYPYSEYMDGPFNCYPMYLRRNNGAVTLAMHSYQRSFYGRPKAYAAMGFDCYLGMEDLPELEFVGEYVGERSFARRILDEYEQAAAQNPEQVFVHAVTMQNHIPYYGGIYSDEIRVKVQHDSMLPEEIALLETVATNVRDVDTALGEIVAYLRDCDRDVVLLVFGDHQTAISSENGLNVTEKYGAHLGAQGAEAVRQQYQTPFVMWSNFEQKAAQKEELLSTWMLLPLLTGEYNLDAPAWFDWLYSNKNTLRGYARNYAIDATGAMMVELTSEQQLVLNSMRLLQHDAIFGRKFAMEAMYGK